MAMANQYGIDLGNIYSTASALKTAQQSQEMNQERLNAYRKEAADTEAADVAEKAYIEKHAPESGATSLAQLKQFSALDLEKTKTRNATTAKVAIGISNLPVDQQQGAIDSYVATLSPEEKDLVTKQFPNGITPQELPHIINASIEADKIIDQHLKDALEGKKHQRTLEEEGVKGAMRYAQEELKQRGLGERTNVLAESREATAKIRGASKGAGGRGNVLKPKLLSYEIKTKIDPKTGDKTTYRINKYDDGTTTKSGDEAPEQKPAPKPAATGPTYKPSEVVRYGMKNGRKVAQMKDGSVIFVK